MSELEQVAAEIERHYCGAKCEPERSWVATIRRAAMAEEKLALVERWASQYEVADKSALDDLAFILKLKGELASPQA